MIGISPKPDDEPSLGNLDLEVLKNKIEELKLNSERLRFLIQLIHRLVFLEEPPTIEESKDSTKEASGEGKIPSARARYIVEYIESEGRPTLMAKERYEIVTEELNRLPLDIEALFNLAAHEVRHRVQFLKSMPTEVEKRAQERKWEIFSEEDLDIFLKSHPAVAQQLTSNPLFMQKYSEIKRRVTANQQEFDRELDAMIVGLLAEMLLSENRLNEAIEMIKNADREVILEKLEKYIDKILRVILLRLKTLELLN